MWLAIRSILWAIVLPGTVTAWLPLRYFGLADVQIDFRDPFHLIGLVFTAAGLVLLITCIWEFAHSGRGTLSPADPPKELVIRGLYRYVRNPMYVSVTTILIGELILVQSITFLLYLILWFAGVNLFVMAYEEPMLRRQFGESYERYTRSVGRWIPVFNANSKEKSDHRL